MLRFQKSKDNLLWYIHKDDSMFIGVVEYSWWEGARIVIYGYELTLAELKQIVSFAESLPC